MKGIILSNINLLIGKIKFKSIDECKNVNLIDSIYCLLQNYMVDIANKQIMKKYGIDFNIFCIENKELKELVIRRASFSLTSIFKEICLLSNSKLFWLDDFRKTNEEVGIVDVTPLDEIFTFVQSFWGNKVYKKAAKLIKIEYKNSTKISISKIESVDFIKANNFQVFEICKYIHKRLELLNSNK